MSAAAVEVEAAGAHSDTDVQTAAHAAAEAAYNTIAAYEPEAYSANDACTGNDGYSSQIEAAISSVQSLQGEGADAVERAIEIVSELGNAITEADAAAVAANDEYAEGLATAAEGFEATAATEMESAAAAAAAASLKAGEIGGWGEDAAAHLQEAQDAAAAAHDQLDYLRGLEDHSDLTVAALEATREEIRSGLATCEAAAHAAATAAGDAATLYSGGFADDLEAAASSSQAAESAANSASLQATEADQYQGSTAQTEARARTQTAAGGAAENAAAASASTTEAQGRAGTAMAEVNAAADAADVGKYACIGAGGDYTLDVVEEELAALIEQARAAEDASTNPDGGSDQPVVDGDDAGPTVPDEEQPELPHPDDDQAEAVATLAEAAAEAAQLALDGAEEAAALVDGFMEQVDGLLA